MRRPRFSARAWVRLRSCFGCGSAFRLRQGLIQIKRALHGERLQPRGIRILRQLLEIGDHRGRMAHGEIGLRAIHLREQDGFLIRGLRRNLQRMVVLLMRAGVVTLIEIRVADPVGGQGGGPVVLDLLSNVQRLFEAGPAVGAAAHLRLEIAPAAHHFHGQRSGLLRLLQDVQGLLHGRQRRAIAPLRREDFGHAVVFDGHAALIVRAPVGLDRLQIIAERRVVLPELGIHFGQVVQRVGQILRNVQLLAQLVGLLQIGQRILIGALIHFDGPDVVHAQRLLIQIAQLTLDLQSFQSALQRFVRLGMIVIEVTKVDQRIGNPGLISDLPTAAPAPA